MTIHYLPMVYLPATGYLELPTSPWGSSAPGNRSSHHHQRIASSLRPRQADPRDCPPPLHVCSPSLGSLSKTTCKSTPPGRWLVLALLWLAASVARQRLPLDSMTLTYSAAQLLRIKSTISLGYKIPLAIKELGLLCRPRYIHRSCRKKFVYNRRHEPCIPSIWTPVAHLTRHQSAAISGCSPCRSLAGNTGRLSHTKQDTKRGVDYSILRPLQRHTTSTNVKVELLNTQSLNNKSSFIQDHIADKHIDFMCLTETWQQPEVYSALNEACPPGYSYLEKARCTGRGGGLAVVYRSNFDLSPLPLPAYSSFECLAFKCKPSCSFTILLVYRPPKPNPAFIPEIHDILTALCTTSANIIILGDFNIHVDTPSYHLAAEFLHLLDCLTLTQHVVVPTHTRGHTLDLVITNSTLISNLLVSDLGVSDHKAISMEIPILFPPDKPKRQISFRNLKNINTNSLTFDLQQLSSVNFQTATDSVNFYNASLSSLLDLHAPVKTRTVTFPHSAPWYTSELRAMKRAGRVLEWRLKVSGLTVHKLAYREHQKAYSKSLSDARSHFYSRLINNNPGNSKRLFSTVNNLLKPHTPLKLDTTQEQCNKFISFFRTKVDNIRTILSTPFAPPIPTVSPQPGMVQPLCCFMNITQREVEEIMRKMKPSTCALDPFPSALIKTHTSAISPMVTKIINCSLQSGHIPSALKVAVIKPLLKKTQP